MFVVYLYGHASTRDYRKTVPQIREGQYEGLREKVGFTFLHISIICYGRHDIFNLSFVDSADIKFCFILM